MNKIFSTLALVAFTLSLAGCVYPGPGGYYERDAYYGGRGADYHERNDYYYGGRGDGGFHGHHYDTRGPGYYR